VIAGEQYHRPDRIGLVLDRVVLPSVPFLAAYEVWPGASAEPPACQLLDGIARNSKVCVTSPDRTITRWALEPRTVGLFD
jgi:hypothetical protein